MDTCITDARTTARRPRDLRFLLTEAPTFRHHVSPGAEGAGAGTRRSRGAAAWIASFARRRGFTLVALALVVAALSTADLRGAARVLAEVGPRAAMVSMAAFVLETLVDVRAWRFVARTVGHRLSLGRTIAARLGLEAIAFTAPGGALTADLAGPFVLRRFTDLRLSDAVSVVLLRKWGILAGHALFLAVSTVLGASFLEAASRAIDGGIDLALALGVSAAIFVLAALSAQKLLCRGSAERLGYSIARIPWYRARRFVAVRAAAFVRADATTSAFFEAGDRRVPRLVLLSLALWLLESLEAFAILTLLGARPGVADIMAMEALLTVVRTIAFFLPAGLGVRELGHLALIVCLPGGTPEIAAAYVVLRRGLELFYALLGVGATGRDLPTARREAAA